MGLLAVYAVPHPPLAVPAVGPGPGARSSQDTARRLSRGRAAASRPMRPTLVVITSPHAPAFRDGFLVSDGRCRPRRHALPVRRRGGGHGRATTGGYGVFRSELRARLRASRHPHAAGSGHRPRRAPGPRQRSCRCISCAARASTTRLPPGAHRPFGAVRRPTTELRGAVTMAETAEDLGRTPACWWPAGTSPTSCRPDGPYGYATWTARAFDARRDRHLPAAARLSELFALDGTMCDQAARMRAGARSMIAAGALRGPALHARAAELRGALRRGLRGGGLRS